MQFIIKGESFCQNQVPSIGLCCQARPGNPLLAPHWVCKDQPHRVSEGLSVHRSKPSVFGKRDTQLASGEFSFRDR